MRYCTDKIAKMSGAEDSDDGLIQEITPDILKVLSDKRFFEVLDDLMCPDDPARSRLRCNGTYTISNTLFFQFGFDLPEIEDITQVLAATGGCCDCEILFNVAQESRLRSEYWKARAAGVVPPNPHSNG